MKLEHKESQLKLKSTLPETASALSEPAASTSDQLDADRKQELELVFLGEQFEILERIGQGGMGSVYKVKDKNLDAIFAIKVLHPELAKDQAMVQRFGQEAEAASALAHPNLVAVYGNGVTSEGTPYLVMDYLKGESLQQILKHDAFLKTTRALDLFIQICEGCQHAHDKGVIHRDLKPGNVIVVTGENNVDVVKIVDFGIAKIISSADRETQNLTREGDVFGSPHYMSPEQCLGFNLDARSDIYSLGCLMFETLVGKPPFDGSNSIQIIAGHLNEPPETLRKILSKTDVSRWVQAIVLRCLEKDATNRYQSMNELRKDLARVHEGGKPQATLPRSSKPILSLNQGLWLVLKIWLIAQCAYFLIGSQQFRALVYELLGSPMVGGELPMGSSQWMAPDVFWGFISAIVLSLIFVIACVSTIFKQFRSNKNAMKVERTRWFVVFTACLALAITFTIPMFSALAIALAGIFTAAEATLLSITTWISVLALALCLCSGIGLLLYSRWKVACTKKVIGSLLAVLVFAAISQRGIISAVPSLESKLFLSLSGPLSYSFLSWGLGYSIGYNPGTGNEPVPTAAQNFIDQAIWLDPHSPDLYLQRALLARVRNVARSEKLRANELSDLTAAVDLCKRNPRSSPVSLAELLSERASYYISANMNREACRDLTEAIESDPASDYRFIDLVERSKCYTALGDLNKALADLNLAISIEPQSKKFPVGMSEGSKEEFTLPKCYSTRASTYEKLGQLDKAVEDLSQAIQLQQERYSDPLAKYLTSTLYNDRANIYEQLGSKDLAAADWRKAKELQDGP